MHSLLACAVAFILASAAPLPPEVELPQRIVEREQRLHEDAKPAVPEFETPQQTVERERRIREEIERVAPGLAHYDLTRFLDTPLEEFSREDLWFWEQWLATNGESLSPHLRARLLLRLRELRFLLYGPRVRR